VYFSHSAPSHLYPLSLHDALPICLISSKVQDTMRAIRTFAILGIAALYLAGCQQEQAAQPAPPPPEVTVTQPVRKQIVQWDRYTGRLAAVQLVEVRPRVSGYLKSIHFDEGQMVKQGDLLFVIDPRPFEAALNSVTAQLEEAQ